MDKHAEQVNRKRIKRNKRRKNARLQRFNAEHKKGKIQQSVTIAPHAISEPVTKTEAVEAVAVEQNVPVVAQTLSEPVETPKI